MNPILTPVERLILENQVAMLEGIATVCALFPNETFTIDNNKRETIKFLHALADNTRFVLEKSK